MISKNLCMIKLSNGRWVNPQQIAEIDRMHITNFGYATVITMSSGSQIEFKDMAISDVFKMLEDAPKQLF